jgi:hypothetical protein
MKSTTTNAAGFWLAAIALVAAAVFAFSACDNGTNPSGKTPEVTLVSIEVTKNPNKTDYEIGEQLDITGIEVTASYSNNTSEKVTVTVTNITGFNSATAGNKTLTVT